MSNLIRKIAILSCFLFTSFCFWKAGAGVIGDVDAEILPSAQAAVHPSVTPSRMVTTPIQQMRPGMRVVGRNPIRIQTESTIDPTPEGWRLLSVRMRKEDGTYFEAELLRPLSWIRRHRAQPGAVIELNMPELHVVGVAEVLSISDCPPIDPGDGPVVLSTFKNIANNVLNIYVEGETDPIGVTAGHPIWSEDRQAFVHSDQLQPGERLRSALGKTVRITSIEIRAGPEPVYNLEVAGEHVYSVTNSGLLVHNTGQCDPDLYVFDKGSRSARLVTSRDINAPTSNVSRYTRDEFEGRNIYRAANDFDLGVPTNIDPKYVHKSIRQKIDQGWTNADLMKNGNAPIGRDGRPINLHHVLGDEPGPMLEILGSTHKQHHGPLHGLIEDGNSFRNIPGLESQYNSFRGRYWKWRIEQITGN